MSNRNITGSLSFGSIDQMSKENKGAMGEAFAGIWLKEQIKADASIVTDKRISEPSPRFWFSHLGRHRCKYGRIDENGVEEIAWEPDYSFYVTLPDHDVRKEILIEAKTGSSELRRNQLEVMELIAQEEDTIVFYCEITLDDDHAKLDYEVIGRGNPNVEVKDDEGYYECYDCGSKVNPDEAQLVDRDGTPVYVCSNQECQ